MKTAKSMRRMRPFAKKLAKEQRGLQLIAARIERMLEEADLLETTSLANEATTNRLALANDVLLERVNSTIDSLRQALPLLNIHSVEYGHVKHALANLLPEETPDLFPQDQQQTQGTPPPATETPRHCSTCAHEDTRDTFPPCDTCSRDKTLPAWEPKQPPGAPQ